jgi:hypothetical protein
MSATLCACTFPQPPNEAGAEADPDLAPAAGAINGFLLGLLILALGATFLRLVG